MKNSVDIALQLTHTPDRPKDVSRMSLNVDSDCTDHEDRPETDMSEFDLSKMDRRSVSYPNANEAGMPTRGKVISDRLSEKTPVRSIAESQSALYLSSLCEDNDCLSNAPAAKSEKPTKNW